MATKTTPAVRQRRTRNAEWSQEELAARQAEKRAKVSEFARKAAAAINDVGKLPPIKNKRRRIRCNPSFRKFCEGYLKDGLFPLKWSPDHLRVIAKMQRAVLQGGLFALAMPRGSGKTALVEALVMWAVLYGHRRYVLIIGADADHAEGILDAIKVHLTNNPKLIADFPEVCVPLLAMKRSGRSGKMQHQHGKPTYVEWRSSRIVLPTIDGSEASGSVIEATGLTGSIRGRSYTNADGEKMRPDFVVPDDVQTDQSAQSRKQTDDRETLMSGAVLGLAGPGKFISGVAPLTVIRQNDLADRLLGDDHPEWDAERTRLLNTFPDDLDLWQEYWGVRLDGLRAGDEGKAGNAFYRKNRKAMDAGGEASWSERMLPGELSAIQSAMNLFLRDRAAFFAEYQNDPRLSAEDNQLTPARVLLKRAGRDRGICPPGTTHITAGVDIGQNVCWWVVIAWREGFAGQVIDWGPFPSQDRPYFVAADARPILADIYSGGPEARVLLAAKRILRELREQRYSDGAGGELAIDRIAIDSGDFTTSVYAAAETLPGIAFPIKGLGIRASGNPLGVGKKKKGVILGDNWIEHRESGTRLIVADVNYWKSFVYRRLCEPLGDSSSLELFGYLDSPTVPPELRLLAEHCSAEYFVETHGRGRQVDEWSIRPERPDNHGGDCVVYATVAASTLGIGIDGIQTQRSGRRRRRYSAE